MKKFIFMVVVMFMATFSMMNAQNQSNYAGSSKFGDNWSLTLGGGVVTPFSDFFKNGSVTPIIIVGTDKYVTPWLGFGAEGRTSIGTGTNYNPHTAFDMVNISGYAKLNVLNLFNFTGTRKLFEPVIYSGLGWNHYNCSATRLLNQNYNGKPGIPTEKMGSFIRNSVSGRVGAEWNFNLGEARAWCVGLNTSYVWGNIDNMRLDANNGHFELAAQVTYHFKTSNGTHAFTKAKLYDQAEIDRLNARIAQLESRRRPTPNPVAVPMTKNISVESTYVVTFGFDSDVLGDTQKEILNNVKGNVSVVAYASPEGTDTYNKGLSERRAEVVKNYLESRGVTVVSTEGKGAVDNASNRIAIVTVK